MIEINKNPSARELKQFGALWLIFFAIVGGITWYRTGSQAGGVAVWTIALVTATVGFLLPSFMRLVYVGMSYAAFPIGWLISHIVLALAYYLVLTPIAFVLKMAARDSLELRFDRSVESYWTRLPRIEDSNRYFRQF